jgi:decaprenylphospho-beta-D-erythro-pentofuranosid-2-ulose 2-reductase
MTTKETVLILGANSDIARAVARAFAADGHPVHLAGRAAQRLEPDAQDLRLRNHVPVAVHEWDALDPAAFEPLWQSLRPPPRIVVCAVGLLSHASHELVMRTNYLGPSLALERAAALLAAKGGGVVVGISSVAGDRGRASNYVYGSAKAGFTAFLSGLRGRMLELGVRVVTVKPGFVDTAMTRGMALPKSLTAQPEEVAAAIVGAVRGKRDVLYVRPIWRWIMLAIRTVPEPIFKRLRF